MSAIEKVWIVNLPVHVIADSAELAADHLARICDRGHVRLSPEDNPDDAVVVVYANSPEGDVTEASYYYEDGQVVG